MAGFMQGMRGLVVAAGVLAAGAGPLAAQTVTGSVPGPAADAKLLAAAKAEGKVSVYGTSSVVALKSDAEAFEKAYGIRVNVTQVTSGPMTARVDQEIRAGRMNADVVMTADRHSLYRWIAASELTRLPAAKYPERTDYLAHIQVVYQAVFYNSQAVASADVPKTWNDVLNPKFSGKIVLGSPRISPAYSELYYALWKDPQYGQAFFDKLAALKPRVVQNNAMVAQLVASGEGVVGFTALPYDGINIKTSSPAAPIEYSYLDVVTVAPTFMGLNAKAQNPNAARLFALWMMSPAGQVAHNGSGRASSMLGNLPGTLAAPDPKRVRFDVTAEKVSIEYSGLIAMFDRIFK